MSGVPVLVLPLCVALLHCKLKISVIHAVGEPEETATATGVICFTKLFQAHHTVFLRNTTTSPPAETGKARVGTRRNPLLAPLPRKHETVVPTTRFTPH